VAPLFLCHLTWTGPLVQTHAMSKDKEGASSRHDYDNVVKLVRGAKDPTLESHQLEICELLGKMLQDARAGKLDCLYFVVDSGEHTACGSAGKIGGVYTALGRLETLKFSLLRQSEES